MFISSIILAGCSTIINSLLGNNQTAQQSVTTVIENIEVDDIHSDEGRDIYTKAILAYARRYNYYHMDIFIDDIQVLIDGNFSRYKNGFIIRRATRGNWTFYVIAAQFNCMSVLLSFSDEPFEGGVSTITNYKYDQRYSSGENERLQAARSNQNEWDRFFESKYNEAIFKLTIERRKIPQGSKLDFNIWQDLQELEFHKSSKTLWFTGIRPSGGSQ